MTLRVLVVGDLHDHPWPVFPPTPDGENGYVAAVRAFLRETLPRVAQTAWKGEAPQDLVILGDLAEEPYKRGKIGLGVMRALQDDLAYLARTLPGTEVHVLPGNHDMAANGVHWLGALRGLAPNLIVEDEAITRVREGGLQLSFLPWRERAHALSGLRALPKSSILFGHFVFEGAAMDNGMPYADEHALPKVLAQQFLCSFLGHAHTPGNGSDHVYYVGAPLPYSWALAGRTGSVVALTVEPLGHDSLGTVTVKRIPVPGPFFTPETTLADLSKGERPPLGAFVRLLVALGDAHTVEEAQERFPGLRFQPVIEGSPTEAGEADAQVPRLGAAVEAATAAGDASGLLRAYVEYQRTAGAALPEGWTDEELAAVGARFLEGRDA
jgi:hypothetical protein